MRITFCKISAIAASTCILAACGSADDENSITGAFNKEFDASWETEFVKGCTAEAVKTGAPEAQSSELCGCVAEELLMSLDGMSEKMNPPVEKLDAAAKACMPGLE